jgi:NADH-quinone oxidoreductase subunit A
METATDPMDRNYLPILLLVGFVIANAILMIALSAVTMRPRPTPEKQLAYESGVTPLGTARERFSVKFYMVAMLFIVFDIETVFLLPWGAHFRALSCKVPLVDGLCPAGNVSFFGLGEMLVFMAILFVGYIYVWKKGALQWD